MCCVLVACSSDDDPEPDPAPPTPEVPGGEEKPDPTYTQVALTYSGSAFYGKDVALEVEDSGDATITLKGVLPLESETKVQNITLTEDGDGYTFETSATSAKGTTFKLSGSVKDDVLSVNLTEVQIPSNPLSSRTFPILANTMDFGNAASETEFITDDSGNITQRTTYNVSGTQSLFLNWQVMNGAQQESLLQLSALYGADLTPMVQDFLSKLIYLVLQDITFLPDGNIVANYGPLAESMKGMNLMALLTQAPTESMRGTMTQSPLNLCRYFVEDGKVYIQPDLDMIMYTVAMNNGGTSGSATGGFDMATILQILAPMLSEGVKFDLVQNDPATPFVLSSQISEGGFTLETTYNYYFDCEYRLCMDPSILTSLLPLMQLIDFNQLLGSLDLQWNLWV
ncbi:MAG: DUF4925 domain-containing protein [Tannerellaceae bacterium]|nr:DUF4925 domain-containing protein [Tannerellaceae bacterium]